ncbi:tRNA (uracil-5-)-methyltransferase homolog B-like isoform 2-T2 [Salvelinus alpinus]|uniref:tRNA (uracil-5-)-methyltransferase homolog B-like isoform X2 n=1 Tax=Salvelinus alpinus TaxID=8036 RepID=UPI0039FBA2FA
MLLILAGLRPALLKHKIVNVLVKACLCSGAKDDDDTTTNPGKPPKLSKKKWRKKLRNKPASNEHLPWEERLADSVTPLWRLSYYDQLQLKQKHQERILLQLSDQLLCGESTQHKALTQCPSPPRSTKLSFPLLPILPSPVRDGYRNKSTFSVNRGVDGNPKTVGFYVGTGKVGNIVCVNGDHLLNMPERHKLVARCYQDFLRLSALEPCLLFHDGGHWREILGFKFRISADAFFQVNQGAADSLYRTVREMGLPNGAREGGGGGTLLDVCCGTGAIGITMSPRADRVIGIELIQQAVEDARHNAALNQIQNCEFLPGKAEVVLPGLMEVLGSTTDSGGPLTAVVNPARAGLHYRVIRALRNNSSIRRLLYISCKPEGEAMRNFRELCCSPDPHRKLTGEAFRPTVAVPVDMFPHTPHCELLLVFER